MELTPFGKEMARRLKEHRNLNLQDYYEVDLETLKKAVSKVHIQDPNSPRATSKRWFGIARLIEDTKKFLPERKAQFESLANTIMVLAAHINDDGNGDNALIPKELMHVVYLHTDLILLSRDCYLSQQEFVKPLVEGRVYHLFPRTNRERLFYERERNSLTEEAKSVMDLVYSPSSIMTHFTTTILYYLGDNPHISRDCFLILEGQSRREPQKLLPPPENFILDKI